MTIDELTQIIAEYNTKNYIKIPDFKDPSASFIIGIYDCIGFINKWCSDWFVCFFDFHIVKKKAFYIKNKNNEDEYINFSWKNVYLDNCYDFKFTELGKTKELKDVTKDELINYIKIYNDNADLIYNKNDKLMKIQFIKNKKQNLNKDFIC